MNMQGLNECWAKIQAAKSIAEVEKLINSFPEDLGAWDIQIEKNSFMEDVYVVYNDFYNAASDNFEVSCHTLELVVE